MFTKSHDTSIPNVRYTAAPWSREHDVTATDHLIRFSLMAVSPAVTYRGLVQRTCRAQLRRGGNVAYLPPPLSAGSLLASSNAKI